MRQRKKQTTFTILSSNLENQLHNTRGNQFHRPPFLYEPRKHCRRLKQTRKQEVPVCRIKIYRARGEPRGSDLSSSPVATTARDNNSRHREAIRFKSRDSRGAVAEIQEGRSGGRAEPGRKPVAEAKDVRGRCRRVREPRPDDHDASCRDGEEIERDGPCWRLNAGRGRGVPGADSLAASPRAFYTLAGASAWRRRGVAEAVPRAVRCQARHQLSF